MPEALARSNNDSILSRPARPVSRKGKEAFWRSALRPLLSRPARTAAGAALAAILTGIVVNALVMQKERHPAPFFAAPKPAATSAEPPPPPPVPESAPVVAQPPVRPANLGAAADQIPLPPSRSSDAIRDLLRGDAVKEATRLTIAAQNSLIKLGFVVKADGVEGASTKQAIEQFERAHGLPPSGEINARLAKQLAAAANAAAR